MTLREQAINYWVTPDGISRRIAMLSHDFTYRIVNNALMAYGSASGIKRWMWLATMDEKTCVYCASKNGKIYRSGMFLPRLPAHPWCRCVWALLF
jgi:SPP1 gp7 family putative phage head morphogenesis protein